MAKAVRQANDLVVVKLDVASNADAETAAQRFIAGADAFGLTEQDVKSVQQQIDAYGILSTAMAFENP